MATLLLERMTVMKIPVTKMIMADKALTKALLNQLTHLPRQRYQDNDLIIHGYVNTDGKSVFIVQDNNSRLFFKSDYLSAFREQDDGSITDVTVSFTEITVRRKQWMHLNFPTCDEANKQFQYLVEEVNNAKQIFI